MDKIKIGLFLADLRKKQNITQSDEAAIINVSPQAISKWEVGETIPDIIQLESLAKLYQVTIDEIIKGEKNTVKNVEQPPIIETSKQVSKKKTIVFPTNHLGTFIYGISAIVLLLIFGAFSFVSAKLTINIYPVTVIFNLYDVLFKTTGTFTSVVWLGVISFYTSALLSIGVWLSPNNKKAFWVGRLVTGYCSLAIFVYALSISIASSQVQTGTILITILITVYMILIHSLKMNKLSFALKN